MMYRTCQLCGSHLDCGETCDCQRIQEKRDDPEVKAAEGRKEGSDNGKV